MAGLVERIRRRGLGSRPSTDEEQLSPKEEGTLNAEEILELLTDIIKAVVDFPSQVEVLHVKGENTHVFTVRVDKSDIGKVIGKQGAMVNAIRKILTGIAAKNRSRAVLDIEE